MSERKETPRAHVLRSMLCVLTFIIAIIFQQNIAIGSSLFEIHASTSGCAVLTAVPPIIPPTEMINDTSTFTIVLDNTAGTVDWIPGAPMISPAGEFSLQTPGIVKAGQTLSFKGKFVPKSIGLRIAEVTFPNAGPCGNDLAIQLLGQGVVIKIGVHQVAHADGFILGEIFPNPTTGITKFNYTTPKESEIRITLSDMTGKVVKTITSGRVSEGEHPVTFDASDLPSGSYIISLESGNVRLTRELILAK